MIAYLNGAFLPKEEVTISPDDRGFLFADGAYEVIRSYDGKLFKAGAHLQRLARSLRELRIDFPGVNALTGVAEALIQKNGLQQGQATVYFQVTRGVAPRTHRFPVTPVPATVFASASVFHPHQDELDAGIKIVLVSDTRWTRCDIKSISLLPNILAHQHARDNGAPEAIFIRDGAVTEGSHSNFFAVLDGQLWTGPESNLLLAGITRQIVLDLAMILNIPVKKFPILETRLKRADELFIAGTTVEITPVVRVDDWTVGDGQPGPITKKLQAAFYDYLKTTR
ncbi:MAG: D-amino-acid transaminase [Candidatus Zhuqueibacterota bacterium]